MNTDYTLDALPRPLKKLVMLFVMVMLFGYVVSFYLLASSTNLSPQGIEESYNGNEMDEDAEVLKFKKSEREISTTIHNHLFSLGVIFLVIGGLLYFTNVPKKLKNFLMLEPLASIIVTFSSLVLLWKGITWFKYVAMFSGISMHIVFVISLILIVRQLFSSKSKRALEV